MLTELILASSLAVTSVSLAALCAYLARRVGQADTIAVYKLTDKILESYVAGQGSEQARQERLRTEVEQTTNRILADAEAAYPPIKKPKTRQKDNLDEVLVAENG